MDRGAWWVTVHRATKSQTQLKWLSTHSCPLCCSAETNTTWYSKTIFQFEKYTNEAVDRIVHCAWLAERANGRSVIRRTDAADLPGVLRGLAMTASVGQVIWSHFPAVLDWAVSWETCPPGPSSRLHHCVSHTQLLYKSEELARGTN